MRYCPDRYEQELGWPTTGTTPPVLLTGVRFDVLDVPAPAGSEVLRRFPRTGPVALDGERTRFLVAPGSAEELPGLLVWLEWGGVPLDLVAIGPGGLMPAPGPVPPVEGQGTASGRTGPVWLRPPVPGPGMEPSLPSLAVTWAGADPGPGDLAGSRSGPDTGSGSAGSGCPGSGCVLGLVELVSALANACHRHRLLRGGHPRSLPAQPCSRSYASRMVAGTRPRSLTS
jgi:hypothetical protein